MVNTTELIYKLGLNGLYYMGGYHLLRPYFRGNGMIFMLHRVNWLNRRRFAPNDILTVTPDFLEKVILQVKREGFDIVDLDEAKSRLCAGQQEKPFAAFTLDDAYKDNFTEAFPIFEKHQVPFTIYVVSDYSDGKGELWWMLLENIVRDHEKIINLITPGGAAFSTMSISEKYAAYDAYYYHLRALDNVGQRTLIRQLASHYNIDVEGHTQSLIMNWDELRKLGQSPLVTYGAHTKSHFAVKKLTDEELTGQVKLGVSRMVEELGEKPRHFAYPYGDRGSAGPREFELLSHHGFETSVTTRKGIIYSEHKDHLHALPRVSLNGLYQKLRYTKLYMSGVPFAIYNKFKKLDVG